MPAPHIIVVGPNAALQRTLTFDSLTLDSVNRAVSSCVYTGGKGTNFCRAVQCLATLPGHDAIAEASSARLFTFLGGMTGDRVRQLLLAEGIAFYAVQIETETRTCTTCLDSAAGTMTELIGPSLPLSSAASAEMDAAVCVALEQAQGLAIMGSLPDGTDPELYARWARIAAQAGKPVLVDAVKGSAAALQVAGARCVLKVNKAELLKMTGAATIPAAFDFAMAEWNLEVLAVTDGPGTAHIQVRGCGPRRELTILPLSNVVSPLGAGDTADAVFFSLYLAGREPVDAFKAALAAASANCLHSDAGRFEAADMQRIAETIIVKIAD